MYVKHGGALPRGSDAFLWTLSRRRGPVEAQTTLGALCCPYLLLLLLEQKGFSFTCFCFVAHRLEFLCLNRGTFIDKLVFAYDLNRILIH